MLGRIRRLRLRHILVSLVLLSAAYLFYLYHHISRWKVLRQWEAALPQHNLDLPSPEGQNGRYVHFSTQIRGFGWNNVLAETLILSHLSYKANRSYVFRDLRWNPTHYPWGSHTYLGRWPRTPANALLSGPAAGGSWDPGDTAPRAVSEEWFEVVCPPARRRLIDAYHIKDTMDWDVNPSISFETWLKALKDAPESCIEVVANQTRRDMGFAPQPIDIFAFAAERILSLWEEFRDSPVSRLTGASNITLEAVDNNLGLFGASGVDSPTADPFDGILALHIRRGDYREHCTDTLWKDKLGFFGWNQLSYLPDRFTVAGDTTLEEFDKHCYPDDDAILKKIRDVKMRWEGGHGVGARQQLDTVFLMTNAGHAWQEQMKRRLRDSGWSTVVTTQDLVLDAQQTEVSMAIDTELARRAAVFIGNGFSSFTSSINHRRLVEKRDYSSIRFF